MKIEPTPELAQTLEAGQELLAERAEVTRLIVEAEQGRPAVEEALAGAERDLEAVLVGDAADERAARKKTTEARQRSEDVPRRIAGLRGKLAGTDGLLLELREKLRLRLGPWRDGVMTTIRKTLLDAYDGRGEWGMGKALNCSIAVCDALELRAVSMALFKSHISDPTKPHLNLVQTYTHRNIGDDGRLERVIGWRSDPEAVALYDSLAWIGVLEFNLQTAAREAEEQKRAGARAAAFEARPAVAFSPGRTDYPPVAQYGTPERERAELAAHRRMP